MFQNIIISLFSRFVGSGRCQLTKEDAISLGWNFLIIGGSAGAIYLLENLKLLGVDPVIATAVSAWAIKLLQKFVIDNTKPIKQ